MADRRPITLRERNDEILLLTITPEVEGDDLTAIDIVEVYLKTDPCLSDTDPTTLLLSSSDPTQVHITAQSATQITARAFIPASALIGSYDRFWRTDGVTAAAKRRTAMYGPVTVTDL
jgi:hypothetical protein